MNKQTIGSAFFWGACGSFIAMLSVAIGAFAAHGLKASMNEYQLGIIDTAAKYQMYHALAILMVVACMLGLLGVGKQFANEMGLDEKALDRLQKSQNQLRQISALFVIGIFLFSGSLYLLAFTGLKTFASITPIGGVFFLIAWLYLVFVFYRSRTLLCS